MPTVDSVRDLFCSAGDFLQPSSRRLLGLEQIRAGLRIDIDRVSHGGHGATVGFLPVDAGLRLAFAKIKKIVEVQTRQANVQIPTGRDKAGSEPGRLRPGIIVQSLSSIIP